MKMESGDGTVDPMVQDVSGRTASETKSRCTSTSIDWYAEGQQRVVEVGGETVTVRFAGRKGRRARIVIEAPAGALFRPSG